MNLDAWEPPDPPDVADAVIARMHASTPHADEPPSRRWLWALLALPAAAAAIVYVATRGDGGPTDGTITADRARHVELDGASAELEPNTTIRWHHDKAGLRVEQTGTATWRTDDNLRIAAGATSIDATAANLRVEMKMNRQDAAIVATSALTAAAVALVTVTVYNGSVRANNAPVPAGTTVAVAPRPAPAPTVKPDDKHQAAIDACNDISAKREWDKLQKCADELQLLGDGDTATLFRQRAEFESANSKIYDDYELAYSHHDGGKIRELIAKIPPSSTYAGQMVPLATCDVFDLKERGEKHLANGNYLEAEETFGGAYDCDPANDVALRGYLAACKANQATNSKVWFGRLTEEQRTSAQILQICLNMGIDVREPVKGSGVVKLSSTPSGAMVMLDGKDVHLHTPGVMKVPAGKHKITLVVGHDQYTWPISVSDKQEIDFSKKLD